MEDLGIRVKAVLSLDEKESKTSINADVASKIQGKIQDIKVNLVLGDTKISEITKKINEIVSSLGKVGNISVGNNIGETIAKEQKTAQNSIKETIKQQENLIRTTERYKGSTSNKPYSTTVTEAIAPFQTQTTTKFGGDEAYITVVNNIKEAIKFQEKLNESAARYSNALNSANKSALDTNTTKPIQETEDVQKLYEQWERVNNAINSYGNSTVENASQNKIAVETELQVYRDLVKQLQAAEYASTKLRTKSVGEVKIEEGINLNTLENKMKSAGGYTVELQGELNNLRTVLANVTDKNSLTEYNIALGQVETKFKELQSLHSLDLKTENVEKDVLKLTNDIKNAQNALQTWNQNNPKAMHNFGDSIESANRKLEELLTNLNSGNVSQTRKSLQGLNSEIRNIKSSAETAGAAGKGFLATFKEKATKFVGWYGLTGLIMSAKNAMVGMIDTVVDVDSAMVNLYKVTNNTSKEYQNFFTEAKKSAQDLAVSLADIINSTANFSRLGYNLPDATELAKVAALYVNVGDGITADEASTSIISTMKAFNIEADRAETIIDKFNQVGNNFAISSGGIGDSLQRSASALNEANNSLSESIALTVGANNVVQDPEAVGNMWKTVSMRIRGAKTELEEAGEDTEGLIESISTLQSLVKGVTGFDILEADGETFKSTYDIVVGIGKEWSKLSDINQASLLEALAGKRQGNQLASALNNIQDIQKAYQSAEDSAGSAEKENETYQKSAEARINKFKEMLENISTNLLSGDDIGNVVDFGTKVLGVIDDLIDKFGVLKGIVVPLISTVLAFKGKGGDKMISLVIMPFLHYNNELCA